MININELKDSDYGRYVMYTPEFGEWFLGRMKSWNNKNIFVVYKCDNHWRDFKNYTGQATSPKDLIFAECDNIFF